MPFDLDRMRGQISLHGCQFEKTEEINHVYEHQIELKTSSPPTRARILDNNWRNRKWLAVSELLLWHSCLRRPPSIVFRRAEVLAAGLGSAPLLFERSVGAALD
jgi:hypothetical protein